MRIAVVGHVEWVEFAAVERVPTAGEIVHADSQLAVPAGGGGVAAVQLARWGADSRLFTAFGDGALGRRARDELAARGVRVYATFHDEPQRRALTLVDRERERTIIVLGHRLDVRGDEPLPWDELATCDAVYVTAGDIAALHQARRARVVVATSRIVPRLREANIEIDALVGSDLDPVERYAPGDLPHTPGLVVRTQGARGGHFTLADGTRHAYAAVPATVSGDTYGAGDTFAAGLALSLAEGLAPAEAVARAAARAAEVVTFTGPYPPSA